MANPYYDHSTFPAPNSAGSSAAMRTELDLIEQGFDKLPTFSGNASRLIAVNATETALEAVTGNVSLPGNLTVAGSTTLGDAAGDSLTVWPSAVTWSSNPTHSGNHTWSGTHTLSAGTANGVLYLNGSKVATSGSALTFDGTNAATTGTSSATKFIPTGGTATGNGMYLSAANTLGWSTNGAKQLELDSSGNLGLGVTPSAWGTAASRKAIQLGYIGGAALFTNAVGNTLSSFVHNAYDNGTNWLYAASSIGAARYEMTGANGGSTHAWYVSAGGTAGTAISFTQALTLHASGGMSLGNTTDPGATNLSVTGTITSGKGADVASASTVTLGAGNFFDITGTTTISAITIKPAGTVVYLKFDSSLTLQTGTIGSSGALRLTGGASLGVTQYDVLTLISDGTNWWQVAYNNN